MQNASTATPQSRRDRPGTVVGGSVPRQRTRTAAPVPGPAARAPRREARPPVLVAGLTVVVLLAVLTGLVMGWTPVRPDTEVQEVAATAVSAAADQPRLVSEAELARAGAGAGLFYWAGARPGEEYELTRAASGAVYVRYLPQGTAAGASGAFLTVVTYPEPQASSLLEAAAAGDGDRSWRTTSGALVVVDPRAPFSAYFTWDDVDFQVEVFSPEEGVAEQLVLSGVLAPVGAESSAAEDRAAG